MHLAISLNIGYRNSKSQWITSRTRIAKNMDFVALLALIPLDWLVFLSGLDAESAVWCRLNKMLLYWSKISPGHVIFSARGGSLTDLLIRFFFIVHIFGCVYYYIG